MSLDHASSGAIELEHLESVLRAVEHRPEAFPTNQAVAESLGLSRKGLTTLFLRHLQTTPDRALEELRIRGACRRFLEGARSLDPRDLGFPNPEAFRAAFRRQAGLDPESYRALLEAGRFVLELPPGFRVDDLLRFHGRDPKSVCERVEGSLLCKAYLSAGTPAVLSLAFEGGRVVVDLDGGPGTRHARAEAHAAALRLMGHSSDPAGFEAAHPGLALGREGLRIPLTLDPFEALVWAVLGQQVNLPFAYALRRDLVRLAGLPASHGLIAHPDAARVAALAPESLQARRCSRRKAEYVIDAARAVAEGRLRLDGLATATGAERQLRGQRGCGPWTAGYVMMRGLGFGDCVPIGDTALTLALQRTFALAERPDGRATERLMAPFAPFRSLATFHLWASLKGVPA